MRILAPRDPDPGFPCRLCAVRPDIDCSHRPADPLWSMGPEPPDTDTRRLDHPSRKNGRWSLK